MTFIRMTIKKGLYCIIFLGVISFLSCNSSKTTSTTLIRNNNISKEVISYPLSLTPLKDSLKSVKIKSRNVLLKDPVHGLQSFDFDRKGNVYYSQLSGSGRDEKGNTKGGDVVHIIKSRPNSPADNNYMSLRYFGHGGTLVIEESKDGPYVWVSSNATKHISGDRLESDNYWGARSISRIKYEKGKAYEGYGGETYFLNKEKFFVLIAAIDESNEYICFLGSTRNSEGLKRYFYTYKLSEVKASPMKEFKFEVRVGGEKSGEEEHTTTRKLLGHDLSKLEPLDSFCLVPGKNWSNDVNTYSNQGIEIDPEGYIYFYEGNGPSKKRPQGAYVTVFDLNGKVVRERTRVEAISDKEALFHSGLTNKDGSMEAEGIKIIKNKIFLGYSSSLQGQNGKSFRGSNIFEYKMKR